MWHDFGFQRNIYDTHAITGNEEGSRLLVGRTSELSTVKNRIRNMNSLVSVEGPNGVGKTSLVLVAGHQLEQETASLGKNSLILLQKPHQFTSEKTAVDFKRKIYAEIASQFIKNENKYRHKFDLQFNLSPLENWLENPLFTSGGASFLGAGVSVGRVANEGSGFDLHVFSP